MVNRTYILFLTFQTTVACVGAMENVGLQLEPEQAEVHANQTPDPAQAAEISWLLANDRRTARARLDAGLAAIPQDPGLLLRRALLSWEELALEDSRSDLLSLIASAPDSLEGGVALSVLLDGTWEHPEALSRLSTTIAASGLFERAGPERGLRVVAAAAMWAGLAHQQDNSEQVKTALRRGGFVRRARVVGPIAPLDDLSFETERRFETEAAWSAPGSFRGQPIAMRTIKPSTFRLRPAQSDAPGLYVVETFVELSDAAKTGPIDVVAQLPTSARLQIGGITVFEKSDQNRREATLHRARLRIPPGRHRVVLSILAARGTAPFVAFVGADGRSVVHSFHATRPENTPKTSEPSTTIRVDPDPPAFPSKALAERLLRDRASAPFGRWLGARMAASAWHHNLDRARAQSEDLVQSHPRSAAAWALRARVVRRMNLPASLATTALRRAVTEDPTAPRPLTGLAGALVRQDSDEALEFVAQARNSAPHAPEPEQVAFRVYRERGWRAEATSALQAAVDKGASASWILRGARYLRGLDRHAQAETLTNRALERAPRLSSGVKFEAALRTFVAPSEAQSILEDDDDPTSELRLAELALADGDLDLAARRATEISRTHPENVRARALLVRLATLRKDAKTFRTTIEALRQRGQSTVELEAQAGLFGLRPRWEPEPGSWLEETLAFDPWPYVKATKTTPAPGLDPADRWAGNSQVILLDRVIDRVSPDGSVLSLRHQVTRLQTKEATDQAGEVRTPAGALALSLKTLKSDGRTLDVDRHAGKDDVSFSALAPGDAVEQKFVQREQARTPWGGYFRTFYFRAPSPLARSEFVVTVPAGATVWTHSYHGAPKPEVRKEASETIYVWRANDVPGLTPEPFAPSPEEYLPHVAISVSLDRATATRANVRRLHRATRPGPPIARIAQDLVKDIQDPKKRARAIFRYVDQQIDYGPASDPLAVFETRRGDATGLFVAMVRSVGVNASVVMMRPGLRAIVSPPRPDPSTFTHSAARVEFEDGGVLWATFDDGGNWLGGLAPRAHDARYLIVDGLEIKEGQVPDDQIETWPLSSSVDLAIDDEGTARGELSLTLTGRRKDGLLRFLKQSRSKDIERLMQGWLSSVLPGAQLEEFKSTGTDEKFAPLGITVRVQIPHFMTLDSGHLVAERLLPQTLAHRSVGLPELSRYLAKPRRSTPLLLIPVDERMTVTLRLPPSADDLVEGPKTFSRTFAQGKFEQRFAWDKENRIARWERTDHVAPERIAAANFGQFRQSIEEVIQLGDNRLVVRVGSTPESSPSAASPAARRARSARAR